MSHAYRNAAAFKRAQYVWDNMAPPEGGPCECAECGGGGQVPDADDLDGDLIECPWCGGTGYVDENGEPFDPKQAERDRDEYADMRRSEA
jgi:hypothetical protein